MKVFTDRRSYNFFCSVQVFELVYFIVSMANNLKKKIPTFDKIRSVCIRSQKFYLYLYEWKMAGSVLFNFYYLLYKYWPIGLRLKVDCKRSNRACSSDKNLVCRLDLNTIVTINNR